MARADAERGRRPREADGDRAQTGTPRGGAPCGDGEDAERASTVGRDDRGIPSTCVGRGTETLSTPRTPSLGRDGVPRGAGALGRASVVGLGALVLAVAVAAAPDRVDETGYPSAALAALPSGPGVLNQYDWGGYLIYAAPRTPVFIDGRLFPYVPGVFDDYRAIVNAHPGWSDVAARRGVRAMIVRSSDPIAVRAPERGWRVAYADAIAVVLLR